VRLLKARFDKIAEYATVILPVYLLSACIFIFLLGLTDLRHCTDVFFYAPTIFAGLYCSRRYLIFVTCFVGTLYAAIFLTYAYPNLEQFGVAALLLEALIRILFLASAGFFSFYYAQEQRRSRSDLRHVIRERNRHIRKLQLYLNVSEALARDMHLEARLQELLSTWLAYIRAESGTILLCNEKQDRLLLAAQKGPKEQCEALGTKKKGEGIAGYVAQTGEPFIFTAGSEGLGLDGIRHAMCAPLSTKEGVIGVMAVCNKFNGSGFDQRDLELLSSITKQVTTYVQNVNLFAEKKELSLNVIMTLVQAIEAKDRYTRGHSIQVTELANKLGRELGLSNEQLEILQTSALLHDVGKIGIPESILNKPGPLTEDEYEQVKQHPAIGAAILKPIKGLEDVTSAIYYHHERYDGLGYLEGLKGKEIPLAARILAVCDTFASMTSDRPHRKELTRGQALKELARVSGKQLDPDVVDALFAVLESLPARPKRATIKASV
jgi:putative nucleotidyltransferase with HDIG domain